MKVTLANLSQATAQQVFDHVARHLLTQGEKSGVYDPEIRDYTCMYRGPHGLMCAAGCLMTDEEYQPAFESKSWDCGLVEGGRVPAAHAALIADLQTVHDEDAVEMWPGRLRLLAGFHKLDAAIVKELEP